MVCLAASIVSKNGKVLLSRQFVDMSRIRVEGLLAAFPKLVGSGKQHTFVETENVRYVYQPLEGMYLLLITNKQSNILEDLETLRLLSKVVPEYLEEVDEAGIAECAFELLFAFDEVISLGHKEEVTVAQVLQNTDMHSFEEELANALLAQKVEDVKSHMRQKASEIDRSKQDKVAMGSQAWRSATTVPSDGVSHGGMEDGPSFSQPMSVSSSLLSKPSGPKGPSKGMKLAKDKKNDIFSALAKEGEAMDTAPLAAPSAPAAAVPSEAINVKIEEKLSVRMNKEGGLEQMGVQGTLTVLCTDKEKAFIQLGIATGNNAGVQFNTHPNIDKALYSSKQLLGVKDPSKPFPIGLPQVILKWRFQSTDVDLVPITVNCWPTPSSSETFINIEYEASAKYDLHNVVIAIPGIHSAPTVNSCNGDWRFDSKRNCVLWTIDLIDSSNSMGSMELVVEPGPVESFFPCTVDFTAKEILCKLNVPKCIDTRSQEPCQFSCAKQLAVSKFEIEY